jgi:hypothetical protein
MIGLDELITNGSETPGIKARLNFSMFHLLMGLLLASFSD